MKVTHDLQGVQQVLTGQAAEKAGMRGRADGSAETKSSDQATLSLEASLAARTGSDSDVRMAKVAEVQQALAVGRYRISSSDVADKIISRMLGK